MADKSKLNRRAEIVAHIEALRPFWHRTRRVFVDLTIDEWAEKARPTYLVRVALIRSNLVQVAVKSGSGCPTIYMITDGGKAVLRQSMDGIA